MCLKKKGILAMVLKMRGIPDISRFSILMALSTLSAVMYSILGRLNIHSLYANRVGI
jgi:hypothetical protein